MRRRGKVNDAIEKFSVIKTIKAIEDANVAVLVPDATQDAYPTKTPRFAGFVLESGRALVVAVNKWEVAEEEQRSHQA